MIKKFKNYIKEQFELTIYDFDKKDIDEISKQISFKMGEIIENLIGYGDYGYAYKLKSNKVLKITSDKNEYEIANYLKNKNTIYLINIYDVRDLKNGLFSIIEDYAQPLNKIEESFLKHFLIRIQWIERNIRIENIDEIKIKEIITEWNKFTNQILNDNEIKNIINDLINIQKEAMKYNINCVDLKSNNIGWCTYRIGKHLVFFDIGSGGEKKYKKTNRKLTPIQSFN
jgi:hypothetical protein